MDVKVPFKPFTVDEVQRITGASPLLVDQLVGDESKTLQLVRGDMGERGLNYMQVFALFVCERWLQQDAPEDYARAVCKAVAMVGVEEMLEEFRQWRTFPALASRVFNDPKRRGIIMVREPKSMLGQTLNLKVLYEQFLERLKQVFPKG